MLKLFATFLLLFAFGIMSGCSQTNVETYYSPQTVQPVEIMVSPVPVTPPVSANESSTVSPMVMNQMIFLSLEEFLYTHMSVRRGHANESVSSAASQLDFASLNTLYFPTNIPEDYHLASIVVYNERIRIWFISEPVTDEAWHNALINSQYFLLEITRWTYYDLESWGHSTPMQGMMNQFGFTEGDLIDGKYFFLEAGNELHWAHGSNRMSLRLPRASGISAFDENITSFDSDSVHDALPHTVVMEINLMDDAMITSLIEDISLGIN